MPTSRTVGQRAGLTRSAVLAAARRLLAEDGLEGLTMRAVADRLGVRPNALYSHVASKNALVEALLDGVLAGVRAPAPDRHDWSQALHELMTSTYEALLDQPDLVPLLLGRGALGPNAQHLGDVVLALLGRGGIEGERATEALRVLIVHVIGFAAFATGSEVGGRGAPEERQARLASNFDSSLEWLLAGIATRD